MRKMTELEIAQSDLRQAQNRVHILERWLWIVSLQVLVLSIFVVG